MNGKLSSLIELNARVRRYESAMRLWDQYRSDRNESTE